MCYACNDYEYEYSCSEAFPGCQGDCNDFICMDCPDNTLHLQEFYMVHDQVWNQAVDKQESRGMLCIGCLELRLGRGLHAADFTDAPVNTGALWFQYSPRLRDRLTRED